MQTILREYREATTRLKELGGLAYPEFAGDPHKIASAKYHFILVIEAAIDLCNHLIAKNSFRVPEDYADTFKVMVENNLLPADFLSTLRKMTGFRNRLVHRKCVKGTVPLTHKQGTVPGLHYIEPYFLIIVICRN